MRPFFALFMPLLGLAGCMTDVPAPPDGAFVTSPAALLPRGTVWRIVSADGMEAPRGAVATLTRTETGIAGNSGCNQYRAAAVITATKLAFHDGTGTLMACADHAVMSYEGRVTNALEAADGVRGQPGGTLVLTAQNLEVARLEPLRAPGPVAP